MDNLADTLIGAALGRTVAGRELPAAGWIGAIAGNAPDWAELLLKPGSWAPRAAGEYLVYHRGITHSFVGGAVEIVTLTGMVDAAMVDQVLPRGAGGPDRKSTRLNSSHDQIPYAAFCLKKT